jgi:hypothetical protein
VSVRVCVCVCVCVCVSVISGVSQWTSISGMSYPASSVTWDATFVNIMPGEVSAPCVCVRGVCLFVCVHVCTSMLLSAWV